MYVGRTLEQLHSLPYSQWSMEELAYHTNVMRQVASVLNEQGQDILQQVMAEIQARGGLPHYGGDYDHPSSVVYE